MSYSRDLFASTERLTWEETVIKCTNPFWDSNQPSIYARGPSCLFQRSNIENLVPSNSLGLRKFQVGSRKMKFSYLNEKIQKMGKELNIRNLDAGESVWLGAKVVQTLEWRNKETSKIWILSLLDIVII